MQHCTSKRTLADSCQLRTWPFPFILNLPAVWEMDATVLGTEFISASCLVLFSCLKGELWTVKQLFLHSHDKWKAQWLQGFVTNMILQLHSDIVYLSLWKVQLAGRLSVEIRISLNDGDKDGGYFVDLPLNRRKMNTIYTCKCVYFQDKVFP